MRLATIRIVNFRCYDDVTIICGSLHALIGSNNAGKSTVIRALDFLFNPSSAKITPHWFHKGSTQQELRIEGLFVDLTEQEKETFKGYLRPDNSFHLARTAKWVEEEGEGKADVGQAYNKPQPKYDWLNPDKIDGSSVKEWSNQVLALPGGESFTEYMKGEKLTVGAWKTKATEFAAMYLKDTDYEPSWCDNPKGFSGVLKGNLPHFELIPAVRDIADEGKVGKTNPYGRLIRSILDTLDPTLKQQMEATFTTSTQALNRVAGKERAAAIVNIESRLNQYVRDVIPADIELEFQPPTVEAVLAAPTMFVDDGFRGPVELKGHGLQRAIIMSILRAYAELVATREGSQRRALILGIEEPEIYMHPPMLRSIRKVLRTIAKGADQVFFSTHSPVLVDVGCFDEIIRVEGAAAGASARLYQLSMNAMIEDIEVRRPQLVGKATPETMREHYSHVYTASRNEGFFAKIVILVEGQTELYALPIYAAALGYDFDAMGVVVVECGTKDQIDRLYRVFNELGIACYVLFDYDLGGDAEKGSASLLEMMGVKIDKPTGVVIHEKFSCFKKDWENDLRGEIPDYEELAGDATETLGLPAGSGKPLRARYIAQTLTSREKPYVPPTVERIVKQAIRVNYVGSCLRKRAVAARP